MTEADQELAFVTTDQTGGGSSAAVPSGANKFWEVELDYAFDDARTVNSYLRLGTFEENPALQTDANNVPLPASSASTLQDDNFHRGHDLAAMIVDFYDDTRDRGESGEPFFTDPADRKADSALLHTKGGWRDHSDGNRISTTRGDKIEVIRGNYQMVVLGRQDQLNGQSRYEAGGGHFSRDNDNLTPGAIFKISWVQDKFNGTWKVIEETTKGDSIVRYHGDVEELYFGNNITTLVGSETSGAQIIDWQSAPDDNVVTANPTIVETTYAESITIQEGSAARPIPFIHDTSYIVNQTEIDHSDTRTVEKNYSEGDVLSAAYVKGTINEQRRGRYVGRFNGNSQEYWGGRIAPRDDEDVPEGFSHESLLTNFVEVFGGAKQTLKLGVFLEMLAPIAVSVMIGAKCDAVVGALFDYNVGWKKEYFGLKEDTWLLNDAYNAAGATFTLIKRNCALRENTG